MILLIELEFISDGIPDEMLHYTLISLGTGIVIYSTVLMNVTDWAYFAAVTFMSVTITHITDANPYIYAFYRLIDTLIGVLVAEAVNRVQLPRSRDTDTLYVSAIGISLLDSNNILSPHLRVELNRMIEDGAKFTISTVQTQARVRELLPGVDLRYPVITMDGAALYNMGSMEYLRTVPMQKEDAALIIGWLHEKDLPFFSSSVHDDLLIIHYTELSNDAMKILYDRKRRSPYRNFVKEQKDSFDNILYIQVTTTAEAIHAAVKEFQEQPWSSKYRITEAECDVEGYMLLKIYDARASRENMLKELEKMMGTKKTVTFGGVRDRYDVYIEDAHRDMLVKELKKRFEPVDFRNWRSILRK